MASKEGRSMKRIITGREVPVPNELENILEPDERVFHSFEQASITGKFGGAHSIYITNRRVAKLVPSAFGLRRKVEDYRYEDMANVTLKKGITRSDIAIKMRFLSNDVDITKIPKDGANRIVRTIQDGIQGRLDRPDYHVESVVISEVSDPEVSDSKIDESSESKIIKCPSCGRPIDEEYMVCPYCGTSLKIQCSQCGRLIPMDSSVCPYCGNKMEIASQIDSSTKPGKSYCPSCGKELEGESNFCRFCGAKLR